MIGSKGESFGMVWGNEGLSGEVVGDNRELFGMAGEKRVHLEWFGVMMDHLVEW